MIVVFSHEDSDEDDNFWGFWGFPNLSEVFLTLLFLKTSTSPSFSEDSETSDAVVFLDFLEVEDAAKK